MTALGVPAVADVPAMLDLGVDVVFVESWDACVQLEQTVDVLRARKPMFLDKPDAASLEQVRAHLTRTRAAGPVGTSQRLRLSRIVLHPLPGI